MDLGFGYACCNLMLKNGDRWRPR